MSMGRWLLVAAGLTAGVCHFARGQAASRPLPHRWLYTAHNLLPEENIPKVEALMRRAAAVGYTGVVLADYKFNVLGRMDARYFRNVERIKSLAKTLKLELVPCVFPIGYSAGLLAHDPNLVEGMPVKDAPFVVRGGKADLDPDGGVGVKNGGFEQASGDRASLWEFQDDPGKRSFIDRQVRHSGNASLRFEEIGRSDPRHGHGRVSQRLTLRPFRHYRLTFWARTRAFDTPGNVNVALLPPTAGKPSLVHMNLGVKRDQEWTEHQVLFNSQGNTAAQLYIGVWEGKKGALWLDDLKLEEVGLVNVIRRDGCPLVVRGEDGTLYQEGRDFRPIHDEKMGNVPWPGEFELYHPPPSIVLTSNSRIKEGQRLRVGFYHPAFIYDLQTTCCLTHPKVYAILRDQMERVEKLFQPATVFMQHDEIRVANWCALCQGQRKTPGQLLAENARRCVQIVRDASPRAKVVVWSDMFDPAHNAKDNYYLVNGTWAGSWEGLAPDVGIVNWYFDARAKNLPWFAARGHTQILAGYYDGDVNDTVRWLADGQDVAGITGVMYTTWQNRYDDLEKFARVVWGAR